MKNIPAHLALFFCNLIWACAYPSYNFVMPKFIEPLPLLTITLTVTALISLISLVRHNKESRRVERGDILAIVGAALLIAFLRKGMLMFGLSMTSPIDGSIISTISPVIVFVISVIVGLEGFSSRKALGVLLGFGGAIGVILSGNSAESGGSGMLGNFFVLMCALISAIYVIWFKGLLKKYDPTTLLRWMFCIAAVVVLPIGFDSVTKVDFESFTPPVWFAFSYLVIMPTYTPNLLLTWGLERVQPTVASIYTYVQPAVAVIISISLGLDKLNLMTALFGILIFSGAWIVITAPKILKN